MLLTGSFGSFKTKMSPETAFQLCVAACALILLSTSPLCDCVCTNVETCHRCQTINYFGGGCNIDEFTGATESTCMNAVDGAPTVNAIFKPNDANTCFTSSCHGFFKYNTEGQVNFNRTCRTQCLNQTLHKWNDFSISGGVPDESHTNIETLEECLYFCMKTDYPCSVSYSGGDNKLCDVYFTCMPNCNRVSSSNFVTMERTCTDPAAWDCTSPTPILNGNYTATGVNVGDITTYVCDDGYEISPNDNATLICLSSGAWDNAPPACQRIDCYTPIGPVNGFANSSSGTEFNDTASFYCNIGYILSGSNTTVCGADRQWEGAIPVCNIVNCSTNISPANGDVNFPNVSASVNDTASFSCINGYSLSGNDIVSCLADGSWSPPPPTCQLVNCSTAESIAMGDIIMYDNDTLFGDQAHYSCLPGYYISTLNYRTCLANGSWSMPMPYCIEFDCGQLNGTGTYNITSNGTNPYDIAAYSCLITGYILTTNKSIRTCLVNGSWSLPEIDCEPVNCGSPPNLGNGTVDYSNGTIFQSRAIYSCNNGFNLSVDSVIERTCLVNGSWSEVMQSCIPDCGPLSSPLDGNVSLPDGTFYGSFAHYACNIGYQRIGDAVRTCLDTSVWNSTDTTCQIYDCGSIDDVQIHAKVDYPNTTTTYGSIAVYSCNSSNGYELANISTRVCIENGSWSLPEPMCVRTDPAAWNCTFPMPILNGNYTTTGVNVGDNTTYVCEDGYEISPGDNNTLTCLSSGTWDNDPPSCQRIDCYTPIGPENGFANSSQGTKFNDIASFYCNVGYILSGSNATVCGANGHWEGVIPVCNIVNCSTNISPANGDVNFPNGSASVNDTASFSCINGYSLSGNDIVSCLADGSWSPPPPTCQIVNCSTAESIAMGDIIMYDNDTLFGDQAHYSCLPGYYISTLNYRTCLANGSWSMPMPYCIEFDCGQLNGTGTYNITSNGTNPYDIAAYSCLITGYILTTNKSIRTCLVNGSWSLPEIDCEPVNCGSPPNLGNGTVDYSNGTIYQSRAIYSCNNGFNLSVDSVIERTCLVNGSWSEVMQSCIPDCGPLSSPLDGNVSLPDGTFYGSFAHYACNIGYHRIGDAVRTCLDTSFWNSTDTTCQIYDCGSIDDVQIHAKVDYPNTTTTYGSIAVYSCNSSNGYELANISTRVCIENGSWSLPEPMCVRTDPAAWNCTFPMPILNGNYTTTGVNVGDNTTYVCEDGYEISPGDNNTLTCLSSGTWDNDPPSCQRIDCYTPIGPENGFANSSLGTKFNDIASFYCNVGYILSGSNATVCGANGHWEGLIPVCNIVNCSTNISPANGDVNFPNGSASVNDTASFSCIDGYSLSGNDIASCLEDGSWSQPPPTCQLVNCSTAESIAGGDNIMYDNDTLFGNQAYYSCLPGYYISTLNYRTCLANGSWSMPMPFCIEFDCGQLNNTDTYNITYNGTNPYDIAAYSCLITGYILTTNESIRTCLVNGSWSLHEIDCEPVNCGSPPNLGNGTVDYSNGTIYQSRAVYSCLTGFNLSVDSVIERTCLVNGSWSEVIQACIPDCGPLSSPLDGNVSFPDGTFYGSFAYYACNIGYQRIGDAVRTCLDTSVWNSTDTTCQIYDCGSIDDVQLHAKVDYPNTTTTYGSIAVYSCNSNNGYELANISTRVCFENGSWSSPEPMCVFKDCGYSQDPPINGTIDDSEGTLVGDRVFFSCNPGLYPYPKSVKFCKRTGVWEPNVNITCIEPPDCGNITTTPDNGNFSTPSGTVYPAKALYGCFTGYEPSYTVRSCLITGLWKTPEPVCALYDCGLLDPPEFGNVTYSNETVYLSVANFTCDVGFAIVGNASSVCEDGGMWNATAPICESKGCGNITDPFYANVTTNGTGTGDVAFYECVTGYQLASVTEESVCLRNGSWSLPEPYCEAVDCGNLSNPSNGYVNTTNGTTFSKKAMYGCNDGYYISPIMTRTCNETGNWSTPIPFCTVYDCGPLPNITWGTFSTTNGTYFNSIATFSCIVGDLVQPSNTFICVDGGFWNITTHPSCAVECGNLSFANGNVTWNGTELWDIATYSCDTGYYLTMGINSRTCLLNQTWSYPEPECVLVDCGNITAPVNGSVVYSNGSTYSQIAYYLCNEGSYLVGEQAIICQEDGTWNATLSYCELFDCLAYDIDIVEGTVNFPLGTLYESFAVYICNDTNGYELKTAIDRRECLGNGSWSIPEPLCGLKDCSNPQAAPVNGSMYINYGTLVGATATFNCSDGLEPVPISARVCDTSGNWTGTEVYCISTTTPGPTISTTPPPERIYLMPCLCYNETNSSWTGLTTDEIIDHIIKDLSIDTTNTTLNVYKYKSMTDPRTSSKVIGIIGVIFISVIFGCLFLLDLLTICQNRRHILQRLAGIQLFFNNIVDIQFEAATDTPRDSNNFENRNNDTNANDLTHTYV